MFDFRLNNKERFRHEKSRQFRSSARYKAYYTGYLIILVFYLFRPVLPYIEYTIHRDYISKYLCIQRDIPDNTCHGKCHLNKQLKKAGEPFDADRNDSKRNLQNKNSEDHLIPKGIITKPSVEDKLLFSFYYACLSDSFSKPVFVPPQG